MGQRRWSIAFTIAGVVLAAAALVVTSQEVAAIYNAAHPHALDQFVPPGTRNHMHAGSVAARLAWERLPLVALLWVLTFAAFGGAVLAARSSRTEPMADVLVATTER
jgi:hypothetical protein